jgi:lipopolysaccharide/colanic/teichoic acid biosynthesis glycosyltransferase
VAALFPPHHWQIVADLRPGLSGIGSIVFRDEESLLNAAQDRQKFYADLIVPYKMALETWYAQRQGLLTDLKLIALTVLVVIKPETDVNRFLPDLPSPPSGLALTRGANLRVSA